MAEAASLRETQNSDMTESDMAAAQQLMQLSDEGSNNKMNSGKRSRSSDDEEVSDVTSAKIEDSFGRDEVVRSRKQRRYRSLVNIYMATRPTHYLRVDE